MSVGLLELFKQVEQVEQDIIQGLFDSQISFSQIPSLLINQSIALTALVVDVGVFERLPFHVKDDVICLAACQLLNTLKMHIPEERSGWVSTHYTEPLLSFLPDKLKCMKICHVFIEKDQQNFNYAPDSLKNNRSFIESCVKINPYVMLELDESLIDNSLCVVALNSDGFTLKCLPEKFRTHLICQKAFTKDYSEIFNFPLHALSYDMVLSTLNICNKEEAGPIIRLLPESDWDARLIVAAVKKDDMVLMSVPYELITPELMFELGPFLSRHEVLVHVPESSFNKNLNHHLIQCNPLLLLGIPSPMRDRVLCFEAVAKNGLALAGVPKLAQTDEMYSLAVLNNGLSLKHVPQPLRDESLPALAVSQNGEAIQFVPVQYIDEVLCRNAVTKTPHAIYKIPKEFQTQELFNIALESIPAVLRLIPPDKRTLDQCLSTVQADRNQYDWVPMHFRIHPRMIQLVESLAIKQ